VVYSYAAYQPFQAKDMEIYVATKCLGFEKEIDDCTLLPGRCRTFHSLAVRCDSEFTGWEGSLPEHVEFYFRLHFTKKVFI